MKFKAWSMVLLPLAASCTGSVSPTDGTFSTDETGMPAQGGRTTVPDNGPGSALDCAADAIPRARLWRLSKLQYANTVSQVFGVTPDVSEFPLDGVSDDSFTSFDTNADKNLVSDQLATLYEAQAAQVASAYVTRLATQKPCVLSAAPVAGCASSFFRTLAGAAFRRPVSAAEAERLASFYDKARLANDATTATRMAAEAILQSPHFLYRFELGTAATGAKVPLTQHELASQLSYFIADAPPDDALRKAADDGELKSPAALAGHVDRLLERPSARQKVQAFMASFLGVKNLADGKAKDVVKFPMFDAALRSAVVTDGLAVIAKVTFDEAGSFDALFDREISLGVSLSAVYGASKRPAVLAHPAVIAALSNEATTSPVHRGLFFRRSLLCDALPPPPANASNQIAKLSDPSNKDGTQRDQWVYFQKSSPSCAGCHQQFQPFGLGLENYDPIGRTRDNDNGKPIDLTVAADESDPQIDGTYKDAVALGKAIAASDEGRACFAMQYTTFGFGREVDLASDAETCRLKRLVRQFSEKDLNVKELLKAMVLEDGSGYRSYP
ncbi:MAG: DUF1592 domain-containing protein [Deltaproteobacteria bacterium]|nr:DUF1592 domain-containing protein [Deltaproteobacteria bacterium]